MRLDNFLTALLPEQSRSQIQRLIKDGHVHGPARAVRAEHCRCTRARRIDVDVPAPAAPPSGAGGAAAAASSTRTPTSSCSTSRRGWSCIRRPGTRSGTLVNALLHHVKDLSGIGGELRPGIVHRLDRGTSGVMVVAKNDRAHQELSRQFHDREVEKEYVALVWGVVQAGRRIDAPIGRDPAASAEDVDAGAARAERRHAGHLARAISTASRCCKVAIATGRTHQIRVHLSAIGHPIVGDPTYGGVHRRVADDLRAVQRLERPFLHSARLAFTHPRDGRRVEFDSPLPPDLRPCSTTSRRERRRRAVEASQLATPHRRTPG